MPPDPDKPICKERGCVANVYKKGYCYEHYEENEEAHADYLYDSRRDRDYERKSERNKDND